MTTALLVGCDGSDDSTGAGPVSGWMAQAGTCVPTANEANLRVSGTADGSAVELNLYGSDASGGLTQLGTGEFGAGPVELEWNDGVAYGDEAPTTAGRISLDSNGAKTYCVTKGRIGFTSVDGMFVFEITELTAAAADDSCPGTNSEPIAASLKGCWESSQD